MNYNCDLRFLRCQINMVLKAIRINTANIESACALNKYAIRIIKY